MFFFLGFSSYIIFQFHKNKNILVFLHFFVLFWKDNKNYKNNSEHIRYQTTNHHRYKTHCFTTLCCSALLRLCDRLATSVLTPSLNDFSYRLYGDLFIVDKDNGTTAALYAYVQHQPITIGKLFVQESDHTQSNYEVSFFPFFLWTFGLIDIWFLFWLGRTRVSCTWLGVSCNTRKDCRKCKQFKFHVTNVLVFPVCLCVVSFRISFDFEVTCDFRWPELTTNLGRKKW